MARTQKTADTIRRGVIIRGETIKAHARKKKRARSSKRNDDDEDDVKKEQGNERRKSGGKKWFMGCYGCGEDHRWFVCHAVGPLSHCQKCTHCRKVGHITKVWADAATT